MKKFSKYILFSFFVLLFGISKTSAETLSCYYNMGNNEEDYFIIDTSNYNIRVGGNTPYVIYDYYFDAHNLVSSSKNTISCPSIIYRGIFDKNGGPSSKYTICVVEEQCKNNDFLSVEGNLIQEKSSMPINQNTSNDKISLSCEYKSNGAISGSNANILYEVINGSPIFSIGGIGTKNTMGISINASNDFKIGTTCPQYLWIEKNQLHNPRTIYSEEHSGTIRIPRADVSESLFVDADYIETRFGTGTINDIFVPSLDYDNICNDSDVIKAMKVISQVVIVSKIITPLIIIVLGMIDFTKAVTSDDEKAISKASSTLIRRLVSGILVFFAPSIIASLLNLLHITDLKNGAYKSCTNCILKGNCD